MAEQERPDRVRGDRPVTVDDVRVLMGASTPHFAMHLRNRIRRLIANLPEDDPARRLGEHEIARLDRIAYTGEVRGEGGEAGMRPLPSVHEDAPSRH
jgi:hypothetical protein